MKISVKGYLHAQRNYIDDGVTFVLFSCDMSESGFAFIAEHEFELEVPDNFDMRAAQIDLLEREKTRAAAEYQKRVTEINERISNLTALELNPS